MTVNRQGNYGDNDQIFFDIGDGLQRIDVAPAFGALPTIDRIVTIDGKGSPAHPSQVIQIDGGALPSTTNIDGLTVDANAAHVTINNLVVENFTGNGITLKGDQASVNSCYLEYNKANGVSLTGEGNTVNSCTIGSNTKNGVYITGSNNFVLGCSIGTNTNLDNLPNAGFGVAIDGGAGNDVGWVAQNFDSAADLNWITRNKSGGVEITGTGATANVVGNNDIGVSNTIFTDRNGNGNVGVYVTGGASKNTIGVQVSPDPNNPGQTITTGSGNVICGNNAAGVIIDQGSNQNHVGGNYIGIRYGTDEVHGEIVKNQGYGVEIHWVSGGGTPPATTANVIGSSAQERNWISGNANGGVYITGAQAKNNEVSYNYIGTNLPGNDGIDGRGVPTGNGGDGVRIEDGSGNTIKENLISGNTGSGVFLSYVSTPLFGTVVDSNKIGTDVNGNDGSDYLPNKSDAISLIGQSMQNPLGSTKVIGNRVIYTVGKLDVKATFPGTVNIDQHWAFPHGYAGGNSGQPGPDMEIDGASDFEFGQQASDTDVLGGDVVQDPSNVYVYGTLTIYGNYDEGNQNDTGDTLTVDGGAIIAGTVYINDGMATLESGTLAAYTVDVASGAELSGVGTIMMSSAYSGGAGASDGIDQLAGTTMNDYGTVAANGNYLLDDGTLIVGYGTLSASNTVTITDNALFQLEGGTVTAPLVAVNSGGILSASWGSISGNVSNAALVEVADYSTLTVGGWYTQTAGATNVGSIYGNATLQVSGLLTLQAGSLTMPAGTLQAGVQIDNGASLSGWGSIDGNVTNDGSVAAGDGNAAALYINGNYTQNSDGSLTITITGGDDTTQLAVSGTAALDGAFTLESLDGVEAQPGYDFRAVTWYSLSGAFASVNLPPANGVWYYEYNLVDNAFEIMVESS